MPLREEDVINQHFLGTSQTTAQPRYTPTTTAAVQQQYSSTSASNSGLTGTSDDDDPPVRLATPPTFQANHIPKGNRNLAVRTINNHVHFFCTSVTTFSDSAAGLFLRSRLRGTQGGRLYTTEQDWALPGLRGACPGRSKSRELASNREIAFRRGRAHQAHGNPQTVIFFFFSTSAAVSEVPVVLQQPSKG